MTCPGEKWTFWMRVSETKNKDVLIQVWSLSVQGEPSPAAQGQLGGCRKVLAWGGAAWRPLSSGCLECGKEKEKKSESKH